METQIGNMGTKEIIWVIFFLFLLLILLWVCIHNFYLWSCSKVYSRRYVQLFKTTPASPVRDRLLNIYFTRFQAYEISGYLILGLCVLILILCVCLFLFAGSIFNRHPGIAKEELIYLSTLSIRAGIALIVFFITRMLLRLYKYCLKISNFYMGRFETLLAYKDLNMDIHKSGGIIHAKGGYGERTFKGPFHRTYRTAKANQKNAPITISQVRISNSLKKAKVTFLY